MIWVKWNSLEEFNTWHEALKKELGLPKLSVDAEGNPIDNSLFINDYVLPIVMAENDIRACIAAQYATGVEISTDPIVSNYEAASV
jgi:hypothetical protein